MSSTNEEKWHECDFIAYIKKYEEPKKDEKAPVEIWDDYDARNKIGKLFHMFKSLFDRMEC